MRARVPPGASSSSGPPGQQRGAPLGCRLAGLSARGRGSLTGAVRTSIASTELAMIPRRIFLASGSVEHWLYGKKKLLWGLSHGGKGWPECRAVLQECGLRAGAEVVACA